MTVFASVMRAGRDRWRTRGEIARLDGQVIAQQFFSYIRVGFDQRTMEFLSNHRIGRGADLLEQRWRVRPHDGRPVLHIEGSGKTTCRLSPASDGQWRGQWLMHEKMDIQLRPISDAHPRFPGPAGGPARALFRAPGDPEPAYEVLQRYR